MTNVSDYAFNLFFNLTANIASGGTTSQPIDLAGKSLCTLYMPSAFTGTSIKILAAPSPSGTYGTVQSGGVDLALVVGPDKVVPIENLAIAAGLRFIKLVSGTAEAADRSIILATKPL